MCVNGVGYTLEDNISEVYYINVSTSLLDHVTISSSDLPVNLDMDLEGYGMEVPNK